MTKLSIEHFQKGIDLQIQQMKDQKQWYIDYRFGSGMSPMLEEFSAIIDKHIAQFELMKQMSNTIDPHTLVGKRP